MSDLFSGLANLTKQVTSNISTYEVRKITDKIQGYVMNYTEAENLVREATNEDPWGPTGPQMKEICHLTFQYDGFHQVTEMLWKRMFEDNKYAWRRVYKSLTLLNYLLQHGSERVIANSRDHVFQLRSLENYKHMDEKGKDQGVNIRHRVGIILELLNDDDKLRAERKKAKADNKERYQGYTSDDIRRGRGSGYNGKQPSSVSSNTGTTAKKYDDGFDDWNDNKKEDYYNKEVNQFSFPEDARQSSHSPELGFRHDEEKEQGGDDDDGFGSFAAARTKDGPSPTPAKGFADFSSAASKAVPVIPPPITVKTTSNAPTAKSATNDLLGLGDFTSPTSQTSPAGDQFGAASPSQPVDFFSAPTVTNNTVDRPPRPPSGGGLIDPAQTSSSGFNVDWNSAPGGISPAAPATGDLFGDFNATASSQPVAQNSGGFASFDAFNGFQSPTAPAPANNVDFFGGLTATSPVVHQQQNSGLDDIFSSNITLTPSAPAPTLAKVSPTPSAVANGNNSQAKIGNTWAGTGGLIDLDNLAGKPSPAKQSLSMNQMQQQKQGSGSNGMW